MQTSTGGGCRPMDMCGHGGGGVKNLEKTADVLCEWPLTQGCHPGYTPLDTDHDENFVMKPTYCQFGILVAVSYCSAISC